MNEKIWCVYMHTNKNNNKKYIGISSDVQKRWVGQGKNYYDQVFGNAIQKYGWDNFLHEILFDGLTKKEACKKEQELILKYKTYIKEYGYNRSMGGDSGSYGAYDTQLKRMKPVYQYDYDGNFIKKHISISSAVRELKPEYKGHNSFNIPTCCRGKRETALGYRWFYDYKGEKIEPILTPMERTINSESKKVYQYTKDGKFVKAYNSIRSAENEIGVKSIGNCILGKTKTAGGYQWTDIYYDSISPVNQEREWTNAKKTVYQYSLDGLFLNSYESAVEAELKTGCNQIGIREVSRFRDGTCGNYQWRYFKSDKIDPYIKKTFGINVWVYSLDFKQEMLFYSKSKLYKHFKITKEKFDAIMKNDCRYEDYIFSYTPLESQSKDSLLLCSNE